MGLGSWSPWCWCSDPRKEAAGVKGCLHSSPQSSYTRSPSLTQMFPLATAIPAGEPPPWCTTTSHGDTPNSWRSLTLKKDIHLSLLGWTPDCLGVCPPFSLILCYCNRISQSGKIIINRVAWLTILEVGKSKDTVPTLTPLPLQPSL